MGHWYTKDGKPMHRIPKKDGSGWKATTKADAKRLGLYPSVTEKIKAVLHPGGGLIQWLVNSPLEAAVSSHKELADLYKSKPEDWKKQVKELSAQENSKAPALGSRVHSAIERYFEAVLAGTLADYTADEDLLPYVDKVDEWAEENNIKCVKTEHVVINHETKDGGTLDFFGAGLGHEKVYLDWKTQGVKGGKPNKYKDWLPQLAQYIASDDNDNTIPKGIVAYNVVISTTEPGQIYTFKHTYEDLVRGKEIFDAINFLYNQLDD